MDKTPQSNRLHVAILGEINSGKSALFNAIMGVNTAIVSDMNGTTTDPIYKSMELLPYGPIVLIDTAGLNDKSKLGTERMGKTKDVLNRTDYAIYAIDINRYDEKEYESMKLELEKRKIPHMVVFTKEDVSDIEKLAVLSKKYENTTIVSVVNKPSIEALKLKIARELSVLEGKQEALINGLLSPGSVVVMVVPLDSEAPKGRLILPQVQFLRDCLDNDIRCNVTTENTLAQALAETSKIDLVITDSQIFEIVDAIVPKEIPLTSFSILTARQKGDIKSFIQGAKAIEGLKDGDKILVAEVCVHNKTHEDIGNVKIPNLLEKITNKALIFDFANGRDYPENLAQYALIVHCGGCMATLKEMAGRMKKALAQNVPITNYGVVLAYGAGILDRSVEILSKGAD